MPKGLSQFLRKKINMKKFTLERNITYVVTVKNVSPYSKFVIHQRVHTEERFYKCNDCEKSFKSSSNLNKHQKIHIEEKSFSCNKRKKTFSQFIDLSWHQQICTGEKLYISSNWKDLRPLLRSTSTPKNSNWGETLQM